MGLGWGEVTTIYYTAQSWTAHARAQNPQPMEYHSNSVAQGQLVQSYPWSCSSVVWRVLDFSPGNKKAGLPELFLVHRNFSSQMPTFPGTCPCSSLHRKWEHCANSGVSSRGFNRQRCFWSFINLQIATPFPAPCPTKSPGWVSMILFLLGHTVPSLSAPTLDLNKS